jgi:hypothetical protein
MVTGVQYTCKAIRQISDYLANNEDPQTLVYASIVTEYAADLAADASIVSLQSDTGHWVYVPARYILTYPITNGIPYRSLMIGISLPSLPAARSLDFMIEDMRSMVVDTLGVTPVIKAVETSRVVLVSHERHDVLTGERMTLSKSRSTDYARYVALEADHVKALAKIQQLEAYIKASLPKP